MLDEALFSIPENIQTFKNHKLVAVEECKGDTLESRVVKSLVRGTNDATVPMYTICSSLILTQNNGGNECSAAGKAAAEELSGVQPTTGCVQHSFVTDVTSLLNSRVTDQRFKECLHGCKCLQCIYLFTFFHTF